MIISVISFNLCSSVFICGSIIQMTAHQMAIIDSLQAWLLGAAYRHSVFATWVEPTPAGWIDQIGHHPFDRLQLLARTIHIRIAIQQTDGVWMLGLGEQRVR